MPAPLPPMVIGPVYAVANVEVQVDNVLPDALVKVLQNGVEVGHATSTSAGVVWVTTTVPLVVGHKITATQTYTGAAGYATPGVASAPSPLPVPVWAVPKALPVPVFLSAVSHCSDSVWLGSLIPGATLTVSQSGGVLARMVVARPSQWFTLTGPLPTAGEPLEAQQEYQRRTSPTGYSALVLPSPPSLPRPTAATPLRACQTSIDLSDMYPGANVEVTNAGANEVGTNPAASYTADLTQPLKAGAMTVQQSFARCQTPPASPIAHYLVGHDTVPLPRIGYDFCPSLNQLTVTNLLAGEILTVSAVSQIGVVTVVGSQGVSSASATVFVPQLPANTVSLRIAVSLCGQTSRPPFVRVPVSTSPGPSTPPDVQTPLYGCSRQIVVTNAYPGCLLTVFSASLTNILANPVVAPSDVVVIPLWVALSAGEHVQVLETGCHANAHSNVATVVVSPNPIPTPVISLPVLTDATEVTVSSTLAGAQVFLYVDGAFRSQVTALDGNATLPVGTPPLVSGQSIHVTQELCGATSANDKGRDPGSTTAQAPATKPSGGLVGNSNYAYANAGDAITGISVTVVITEEVQLSTDSGGDLTQNKQTGYGFQFNCITPTTDPTFWQQYIVTVFDNQLTAWINNWSPKFVSGVLQENDLIDTFPGAQLTALSGYTLPAGFAFTIALDTSNPGGTNPNHNVLGVTFSGHDENNVAFGPLALTLTSQTDQQNTSQNVPSTDLSPVYVIGMYLVGPKNGEKATLESGAGTITITSSGVTAYPGIGGIPAVVGVPEWGTTENSNAVYSEVQSGQETTFTQTFSVP